MAEFGNGLGATVGITQTVRQDAGRHGGLILERAEESVSVAGVQTVHDQRAQRRDLDRVAPQKEDALEGDEEGADAEQNQQPEHPLATASGELEQQRGERARVGNLGSEQERHNVLSSTW